MSIATCIHKTPYGELLLGAFEGTCCLCDWRYRRMRTAIDARITKGLGVPFEARSDPVLDEVAQQLDAFFTKKLTKFDIPLTEVGTPFQKQVWKALRAIPYGKTCSYADLASAIENPDAVRAVASANGANAMSIIVPCHRVIGSDGSLSGYAGGLRAKEKLIELESGQKSLL